MINWMVLLLALPLLSGVALAQKAAQLQDNALLAKAKSKATQNIGETAPGFGPQNMDSWNLTAGRLNGKQGDTYVRVGQPDFHGSMVDIGACALNCRNVGEEALSAYVAMVIYHEFFHLEYIPGDGSLPGAPATGGAATGGNTDPRRPQPIDCKHLALMYHAMQKACQEAGQARNACNAGINSACDDLLGYCAFFGSERKRFDEPSERDAVQACVDAGTGALTNFPQVALPSSPSSALPPVCEPCVF